jgi:hypothetical protein
MQEQVNQLQKQVEDLQTQLVNLQNANNVAFKGALDDVQIERVLQSNITTGTPPTAGTTAPYADNNLLYQEALTGAAQDIKILNFPDRIMIYTWKGQRLAIPVYDASNIVYP